MSRIQRSNPKIQYWQVVVDHVNDTWKHKKRSEYNYPFAGKDMKDLAHFARIYQPWGLMALWDNYLSRADEYTVKAGFSIGLFIRQLPRLVDSNWKGRAATYSRKMQPPFPKAISQLNLFSGPQKRLVKPARNGDGP